ncbi:MAG: hypothetical protein ACRD2A_13965, partial [Vicinamibacterales bacterium]
FFPILFGNRSFGFLGDRQNAIRVLGSIGRFDGGLGVESGKGITLVGAGIEITDALLSAPGGDIGLASVGGAGEVRFGGILLGSGFGLGALSISNDAEINTTGDDFGDQGGTVQINAGSLSMEHSRILSQAFGANGGFVFIETKGALDLNDVEITANAGFGTATPSDPQSQSPGSIILRGSEVAIRGDSTISTFQTGNRLFLVPFKFGGDITIQATSEGVIIDDSTISAAATAGTDDDVGDVTISAPKRIDITNSTLDANIFPVSGTRAVSAGNFVLTALEISLRNSTIAANGTQLRPGDSAGGIEINADTFELLAGSALRVQADGGVGGDIVINGAGVDEQDGILTAQVRADQSPGKLVHLVDSEISATVSKDGDGGNVLINSEFLVIDNSPITARAESGDGGNILLASDSIFVSGGDLKRFARADSQTGVSGTVQVNTLTNDITSSITPLDPSFQDASNLIRPSCAARASAGREGSFYVARAA